MTLNINNEIAILKDICEKVQKINHDLDIWNEEIDKMTNEMHEMTQKIRKAPAIKIFDKTDTVKKTNKKLAKYDNEEIKL